MQALYCKRRKKEPDATIRVKIDSRGSFHIPDPVVYEVSLAAALREAFGAEFLWTLVHLAEIVTTRDSNRSNNAEAVMRGFHGKQEVEREKKTEQLWIL